MTPSECTNCGKQYAGDICPCTITEDAIPPGGFLIGHAYEIDDEGKFVEVER